MEKTTQITQRRFTSEVPEPREFVAVDDRLGHRSTRGVNRIKLYLNINLSV
jgi:hypothetical protein